MGGCQDTQHNDTQHNDTQHNDTQHNDINDVLLFSVKDKWQRYRCKDRWCIELYSLTVLSILSITEIERFVTMVQSEQSTMYSDCKKNCQF